MKLYVVYDRNSGKILQTHAAYIMGNDDPVEIDENELLQQAESDFGDKLDLAVGLAPDNFDPRQRLYRLKVDKATREISTEKFERKNKKRRS